MFVFFLLCFFVCQPSSDSEPNSCSPLTTSSGTVGGRRIESRDPCSLSTITAVVMAAGLLSQTKIAGTTAALVKNQESEKEARGAVWMQADKPSPTANPRAAPHPSSVRQHEQEQAVRRELGGAAIKPGFFSLPAKSQASKRKAAPCLQGATTVKAATAAASSSSSMKRARGTTTSPQERTHSPSTRGQRNLAAATASAGSQ